MRGRGLALFERVSELIACGLAGALLVAVAWRADQGLAPEYRIETFELQYATLWSLEPPVQDDGAGWLMVYVLRMSAALARAH
jgi:hypothetical protein